MYDEDEELCPVCDSTCTCNHLPKDRGSARANGYRPKPGAQRRADGPRPSISDPGNIQHHTSTNPSSSQHAFTPSSPLKIRLILGRKAGGGESRPVLGDQPRRLNSPSTSPTLRRKRSPVFSSSSSSESSSAESQLGGSSSRESSKRRRHSIHVPTTRKSQTSRSGTTFDPTSGAGPSKPRSSDGRPRASAVWNPVPPKSEPKGNGVLLYQIR